MRRPWLLKSLILLIALLLVLALRRVHAISLNDPQSVSGWSLLALIALLTLLNVRKKASAPPLGAARHWLNFHIYAGLFTFVLFAIHVNFKLPDGPLETTLAILYASVGVSGVVGIILSRIFARRLTTHGSEVIYEQIPGLRGEVGEAVEALALQSIEDTEATTIADFHARRLLAFLAGPRNFWSHLADSRRPITRLLRETAELKRFLNESERDVLKQIEDLLRVKDGLDYHHALQTALKAWLFVHIPLTYGLVLFIAVHIVVVTAFAGNM